MASHLLLANFPIPHAAAFLCLVGIIFPLGFSKLELGRQPFLLSETFSTGYSYALFNVAIVANIVALLAIHRFFSCRILRNRT